MQEFIKPVRLVPDDAVYLHHCSAPCSATTMCLRSVAGYTMQGMLHWLKSKSPQCKDVFAEIMVSAGYLSLSKAFQQSKLFQEGPGEDAHIYYTACRLQT